MFYAFMLAYVLDWCNNTEYYEMRRNMLVSK